MLIAVSLRAFASGKPSLRMNLAKSSVKARISAPRQVRACLEMQHADDYFRQTNSDRLLGTEFMNVALQRPWTTKQFLA